MKMSALINTWIKIGNKNPWIKNAVDPPFDHKSFYQCQSIEELKEKLSVGNWALGSAFYYQNLCFINQVDGGDEFLTIKNDFPFESLSTRQLIQENKFEKYIKAFLNCGDFELKNLTYKIEE